MTVVAGIPGILHQMIGMMVGREASMTMTTPAVPGMAAVLVIPGVPGMAAVLVIPGVPGMAAVLVIPGVPGMAAVPAQKAPHQIPALHPDQVENLPRKGSSGG